MKKLINLFREIWDSFVKGSTVPVFTGVLPDERTDEEKQSDYLHEEKVSTPAPTDPFGNAKIILAPYPPENQMQTGSCVYHGLTLALGIEFKKTVGYFVRLSKMFGYRLRPNFPQVGSNIPAAAASLKNIGAPLYTTLPDVYSEAQSAAIVITPQMYTEAAIYKDLEYYFINTAFNDIATLAGIAQNGKGVPICFYSSIREWSQSYPALMDSVTPTSAAVNHEVCILPNSGFIENGKRYVVIQDSALFGNENIRYLSEDFVKARCLSAMYFDKVVMTPGVGIKPVHTFTTPLAFGDNSPEVKALQAILVYEGLLPADCTTGLFGGRTLAGVNAFQNKYAADILTPNGLTAPTGVFGPASIAKANALYAQA